MAEWLISALLDQFVSMTTQQATQQLELLTGVDEEKRQLNDPTVKHWLAQLKDVSYDIDDVLDEWNSEFLKRKIEQQGKSTGEDVPPPKRVRFSFPSSLLPRHQVGRHHTAVKIEQLNVRLAAIANQRSRFGLLLERSSHDEQIRNITTSVIDESEVFVREEDKKIVKDMLLCESSETTRALRVISILGMGGIGKTTLSRLAYNDPEVISHFEKRIWVCVSDPFDEGRISVEILGSLLGRKPDLAGMSDMHSGKH